MSFGKYYSIISRLLGDPIGNRAEELRKLNPYKFYVEHVRNVFGITTKRAEMLCHLAVRQGVLTEYVEVLDPHSGRALAVIRADEPLPAIVISERWQDGDVIEEELPSEQLQKLHYFSLSNEETPA